MASSCKWDFSSLGSTGGSRSTVKLLTPSGKPVLWPSTLRANHAQGADERARRLNDNKSALPCTPKGI